MLDLWRSCRWSYGDRKLWDIDTWEYLIHIWSFVRLCNIGPQQNQHGMTDGIVVALMQVVDHMPPAFLKSLPWQLLLIGVDHGCPRCCWKKALKALIKKLLILTSHLEILTRLWGWTHPLELPKWNVKKTRSLWTSGRLVTAVNILVPGVCFAWWVKRWDVKHGTCRMSASCGATSWVWALKWECICRRDVTTNAGFCRNSCRRLCLKSLKASETHGLYIIITGHCYIEFSTLATISEAKQKAFKDWVV